jgi:hypothetical protein
MMFPLSSFEKMSLQDVDNILGIRRSLYSFLCAFSAISVSLRVDSCEFVDRVSQGSKKHDPGFHTNQHEEMHQREQRQRGETSVIAYLNS